MNGLATNVLVRYLAQDGPVQARKAARFIENECTRDSPCLIHALVLAELVRVLESAYGYEKAWIAEVLEKILLTQQFETEDKDAAWAVVSQFEHAVPPRYSGEMAWFLFVDESGHDRKASPYEVLAGVAIQDRDIWNLINALHAAELQHFGRRYSAGGAELKGGKLLKTKVFRHAKLNVAISTDDIPPLAKAALDSGAAAEFKHFKALALARLGYVKSVFDICARFRCKAFASIIETDAHQTATEGLRKDYAYLFQRFFYFLEDSRPAEYGIIVFDELEKARSHLLIDQAHRYFKDTVTGRQRASLIVPEPFFVHSDLTTGVQIADLIAYCISWGFRMRQMTKPRREELAPFVKQIVHLRHRTTRDMHGNPNFVIWGFAHITDLRTSEERELEQ